MAERRVELIKFETELLRLTALATLAIGGGTVGLVIGGLTPLRLMFAAVGVFVTGGLLRTLWRYHRTICRQITVLEDERLWKQ